MGDEADKVSNEAGGCDYTEEFTPPEDEILQEDRDYAIQKRLTEGGMSRVFLIQSTAEPRRKYVLKMAMLFKESPEAGSALAGASTDSSLERRCAHEWKLVDKIPRHSSLVPILFHYHAEQKKHEVGEDMRPYLCDKTLYLLMPVYDKSLKELLKQSPSHDQNWWTNVLMGMLGAVDHLRSHNLIHGDLKEEQFFLHSDAATTGRLVLGDFGLMWSLMEEDGQTPKVLNNVEDLPNLHAGPGLYAAPETRGRLAAENTRLDLIFDKAEAWTIGFIMIKSLGLHKPADDVFVRLGRTTPANEAKRLAGKPIAKPTQPNWTYDDSELPSLQEKCDSLQDIVHSLLRCDLDQRFSAGKALESVKAQAHCWYRVIKDSGLPVTETRLRDSKLINTLGKGDVFYVDEDQQEIVDGRVRVPLRPSGHGWVTLRMRDGSCSFANKAAANVTVRAKVQDKVITKQRDNFGTVVMKNPRGADVVKRIPDGELLEVLEVDGEGPESEGRMKWKEIEGWVKMYNVVLEKGQPAADPSPQPAADPSPQPPIRHTVPYSVKAKQKDGHAEVVLKMPMNGKNVAKVPNGEVLEVLEVHGAGEQSQGKVRYNQIEGWARLCNLVPVEAQPAPDQPLTAPSPELDVP